MCTIKICKIEQTQEYYPKIWARQTISNTYSGSCHYRGTHTHTVHIHIYTPTYTHVHTCWYMYVQIYEHAHTYCTYIHNKCTKWEVRTYTFCVTSNHCASLLSPVLEWHPQDRVYQTSLYQRCKTGHEKDQSSTVQPAQACVLLCVSPAVNDTGSNITPESTTLPHLLEEGEEQIGCLGYTKVRPVGVLKVNHIFWLLCLGWGRGGGGVGRGRVENHRVKHWGVHRRRKKTQSTYFNGDS